MEMVKIVTMVYAGGFNVRGLEDSGVNDENCENCENGVRWW